MCSFAFVLLLICICCNRPHMPIRKRIGTYTHHNLTRNLRCQSFLILPLISIKSPLPPPLPLPLPFHLPLPLVAFCLFLVPVASYYTILYHLISPSFLPSDMTNPGTAPHCTALHCTVRLVLSCLPPCLLAWAGLVAVPLQCSAVWTRT